MVLAELGASLAGALKRMRRATVIDDKALSDCLNDVSRALLQADVRFETVRAVADGIKTSANLAALPPGADRRRAVHRAVAGELRNMLDPTSSGNNSATPPPFTPTRGGGGNPRSSVVMLVGLQGSGKTTTCTKYADHYRRKGFSPALVCVDTFRAGALDQLKQNAAKAGIPFYGSYTESDPARIAVAGVETFRGAGRDLIVVDTSGRHRQEAALFEEMRQVSEAIRPDLVIFVMDASIGQAAFDQAAAFRRSAPVGAVIVTKMDGHARGGGALSAVAATKSPVIFIGTGEHIQDFEPFDARRFVNRLLGMGDLPGLIEKIHGVVVPDDDDDEQQLEDLMMTGDFTLRLMRKIFRSIQRMGPLGQLVSMIPGFSAEFVEKGKEKEGQAKIRRYTTITSSMTAEELDTTNPNKLMKESRIKRVARGSGRTVKEVVEEHRRIAKVWSKLPIRKMNTNNRDVLKPLVNALPSGMVNQLGGLNALKNMVKQMGATKKR